MEEMGVGSNPTVHTGYRDCFTLSLEVITPEISIKVNIKKEQPMYNSHKILEWIKKIKVIVKIKFKIVLLSICIMANPSTRIYY